MGKDCIPRWTAVMQHGEGVVKVVMSCGYCHSRLSWVSIVQEDNIGDRLSRDSEH